LKQNGEERSQDGREMLAARAADECELGHGRAALARVSRIATSEVGDLSFGSARSFVARLRAFLATQGYDC
jgi:hypothetical protein